MESSTRKLQLEIMAKVEELNKLRRDTPPVAVKNYALKDLNGEVSLLELFGDKKHLFMIHNMGQGCRYCTLWADGLNGFVPHLESGFALALASKDTPEVQRAFANARGWRFRMVSHGGGDYIKEQNVMPSDGTTPGMVCYERQGDKIFRKNVTGFGPGDLYSPIWHILSLAGVSEEFTPQFNYWKAPSKLDDGGENVV
jgi:predicted dithiol-disulfide oxidoreductase (DUF899 family)